LYHPETASHNIFRENVGKTEIFLAKWEKAC